MGITEVMDGVYLDNAATTPVRPEVFEAIKPFFGNRFGNPSSVHRFGREARAALERARDQVASALGADRREIYFTSGGTEADNLAVLGRSRAVAAHSVRPAVAVSAIEHKAVLAAAKEAGREGAEVSVVAVDERGVLDLDALDHLLRGFPESTQLAVVAVMWVNNEVGVVQPMQAIIERCSSAGVPVHTDAVQAFGRVPVRVDRLQCATLAISGHKIGAPKGIGALYVRSGTELVSLVHGGGQERDLRPGTENIAGAVALGVAAELAVREQSAEARRLGALRDDLERGLRSALPDLQVNGAGAERVPHILNIALPDVDQEALLISLDLEGIAVSTGSACQSGAVDPSHVLSAMGRVHPGEASVRLSLGRITTEQEIAFVLQRIPQVIGRVRQMAGVA
jgi:cysteine desulfurase